MEQIVKSGYRNYDLSVLLEKKFWDERIPTKRDLSEVGLAAPGNNWWQKGMRMPSNDHFRVRAAFVRRFSYAMPCRDVLEYIATFSRSIVEVGSGTGFWAEQLRRVGVDVLAADVKRRKSYYKQAVGAFNPVENVDATTAVIKNPDRDLLSVWPCCDDPRLGEAIDKLHPGRLLFYIGEPHGGCTAADNFFEKVQDVNQYESVGEFNMVQWFGLHDNLYIFRKKAPLLLAVPGLD